MSLIGKIIKKIKGFYYRSSSERLLSFYRSGGGKDW